MLKPVEMRKLNVLVLKRHLADVTRQLGELGNVHLLNAVRQTGEKGLMEVDREADIQQFEQQLDRCEVVMQRLGIEEKAVALSPSFTGEEINALLDKVEAELRGDEEKISELMQRSGLLLRRAERLRRLPARDVPLQVLRDVNHLFLLPGKIALFKLAKAQEALGERGVILYDAEKSQQDAEVLVLTSRKNRWGVETDLENVGLAASRLPEDTDGVPEEEAIVLDGKLEEARLEILEHRDAGRRLAEEHAGSLRAVRRQLIRSLAVARAQENFGTSEHLACISGWMPASEEKTIRKVIDTVTGGSGIVELTAPRHDEDVPVQFSPQPLLTPFQMIISNYGAPRYNEIEPSPFVALSFVIMFGIMFGDVGQGATLAGLGLWIHRSRRESLAKIRPAGILFLFCGLASMVFGFCYGSVFGYENAAFLKPLWLSPMHDVSRLLTATVVLGVVCISVAILINVINKIRTKHYFEGVFDRFGIIGIVFYWGALGLGLKAARVGELDPLHIVLVILLPLGLLFISEPLHNLLRHKKILHDGFLMFVIEACVETMETVTAFLSGTVSFVRIGAFALSHAALCLAVYSVADMLKTLPFGGVWAFLVLVCGNILVIAMEGMVAMIQGIRLQYYELFSKYFPGDGTPYHPFAFSDKSEE